MKKKLLIAWNSPYVFQEIIAPLIPRFAEHFQIVVVLQSQSNAPATMRYARNWIAEGVIEEFFLVPSQERTMQFHHCMKVIIPSLRRHHFDLALFLSVTEIFERYIVDCTLPAGCIRVCLQHIITYLLINEPVTRALLAGVEKKQAVLQGSKREGEGLFVRHRKEFHTMIFFLLLPGRLWRRIRVWLCIMRKRWHFYLDRYCIPCVFIGKTFSLGNYDALTQIGSDTTVDAIIFCDELEAQVHQKLFAHATMHVAQYPSSRQCRCSANRGDRYAILSPLSGFVGENDIAEQYKKFYYRDLRNVIKETGIRTVHLRLHPRETGRWPYQLRDYLQRKGIDTAVVGSERPLHEVVCDYAGVAGFASCALRDARALCDFGFVVGFIAVSRSRYTYPRFVYGMGEGIGWIEDDGTYNPDIFVRRKYTAPQRKDMLEILTGLAYNKDCLYGQNIARTI